jgi:hypothetical protein
VCVGEQLLPTTLAKCKYTVNLKANTVQSRLLEVPFRRCAAVKLSSMLGTAFSSEVYLSIFECTRVFQALLYFPVFVYSSTLLCD